MQTGLLQMLLVKMRLYQARLEPECSITLILVKGGTGPRHSHGRTSYEDEGKGQAVQQKPEVPGFVSKPPGARRETWNPSC